MPDKSTKETSVSETSVNYRRYETIKRKNFSNSARLEGVSQPQERISPSLEAVLNKYRVVR